MLEVEVSLERNFQKKSLKFVKSTFHFNKLFKNRKERKLNFEQFISIRRNKDKGIAFVVTEASNEFLNSKSVS